MSAGKVQSNTTLQTALCLKTELCTYFMAMTFVHFNYLVTSLPITYVYDKVWLEGTENEHVTHKLGCGATRL